MDCRYVPGAFRSRNLCPGLSASFCDMLLSDMWGAIAPIIPVKFCRLASRLCLQWAGSQSYSRELHPDRDGGKEEPLRPNSVEANSTKVFNRLSSYLATNMSTEDDEEEEYDDDSDEDGSDDEDDEF
jgi:hypothetical protein